MDEDNKDGGQRRQRREYVAPRVEESAPFEHLILACVRASYADNCAASPDDPTGLYS